jgi:hypothetical protein
MESLNSPSHEDLVALHEKFREIKHSVANSMAVVMALSELGQTNPLHYEKLGRTVLTRGPDIIRQLQEFSNALQTWVKATAPPAEANPANTPRP